MFYFPGDSVIITLPNGNCSRNSKTIFGNNSAKSPEMISESEMTSELSISELKNEESSKVVLVISPQKKDQIISSSNGTVASKTVDTSLTLTTSKVTSKVTSNVTSPPVVVVAPLSSNNVRRPTSLDLTSSASPKKMRMFEAVAPNSHLLDRRRKRRRRRRETTPGEEEEGTREISFTSKMLQMSSQTRDFVI